MNNDVILANLMGTERCDFRQTHACVKKHSEDSSVANAQKGSPREVIQQLADFFLGKGNDLDLGLLHVLHIGCRAFLDVALLFQIVEECFEDFQQVVDIPRLSPFIIHHGEKLLDVKAPDFLDFPDLEVLFQIPL